MDVSKPLFSATPVPAQWAHAQHSHDAGTEAVDGLDSIDYYSPRLSALFSAYPASSRDYFVVGWLL